MAVRSARESVYPALKVYRSSWAGFLAVGFFSIFVNLGTLASPLYMQQIFDRVMQSGHLETLVFLTMIVIFFLAVIAVLDAIRGSILASIAKWWDETVHADLLHAVIQTARSTGKSHSHAMNDLATIRQFVGSSSVLPFFDGPWVPFFVGAIILIHPALGFVAIAAGVLLVIIAGINDTVTRRRMAGAAAARVRAQQTIDIATQHAESVYSMGMLPGVLARYRNDNELVANSTFAVAAFSAKTAAITKFIRFTAQISVLGLGAYFATLGEITPGGMIAASIIMGRALAPAEQAIGAWRGIVGAMQSHRRLNDIFLAAPLHFDRTQQPDPSGHLQLKGVNLLVSGQERPLLRNITIDIKPATLNAIVGHSGSGKSTLCKLLIGAMDPSSGSVRLDGVAMRNWDPQQLGRNIGYLSQSVELLYGTVKENIARMGEPDDEKVVTAARLAGCHDMINSLPNGYETLIGPGGLRLSGGQAQRVGLARAIYNKPKLIILDEPNSNLDSDGEASLQECLVLLREQGCTVIIVSHRPSALSKVDLIITLADGTIQKTQTGEEFMKHAIRPVSDILQKLGKVQPAQAKGASPANETQGGQ
ncbi:type I secretion system permease/ATPase [Roseibium aggregatum]|uniref:type I secretion system permease/ATPase n=1 Tax=Roseibium aggregatum TaxID=187304 RepID=UPI00094B6F7F|nr:type I secretion system permease/ATPase [Roseibium aggregatum]UFI06564.1 type I secretion system permease/ATPase [Roseibium aggregatum]